jgi:hypothetical protein
MVVKASQAAVARSCSAVACSVEEQAPGDRENQGGKGVRLRVAVGAQAFFEGGQPIVDGHDREVFPGHLARRARVHGGEQAYVPVGLFAGKGRPGDGEGVGVVLPGPVPQGGVEQLALSSPGLDQGFADK